MKLPNYTLPQWFCLAGILLVFGATVQMGWTYWIEKDDLAAAILTVGCEAVALGGFVACWNEARKTTNKWIKGGLRVLGVVIVLLAASWIVLTTYGKLADDAQTRAVSSVRATPIYIAANEDWIAARTAANDMSDWEARNPAIADPAACRCPDTIAERQRNFESEAQRRQQLASQKLADLQALIPPPVFSIELIFRSIIAESIKLFGFIVFGIGGVLHKPKAVADDDAPPVNIRTRDEQPDLPRWREVGERPQSSRAGGRARLDLAWDADRSPD